MVSQPKETRGRTKGSADKNVLNCTKNAGEMGKGNADWENKND